MPYVIDMIDITSEQIKQLLSQLLYYFYGQVSITMLKEMYIFCQSIWEDKAWLISLELLKVRKVKWVNKVLKSQTNDVWKILPISYFKCLDKDFEVDLFALRVSNSTDLINEKKIPLFYKECILGLQEL